MKIARRNHVLIALAAMSALASAQETKKTPSPRTAAPASSTQGPATSRAARPGVEPGQVTLPVTGLTKENLAQVKEALSALGAQRYVCDTCKHEQASPGQCPTCKAELSARKQPELASVGVQLDSSSITLMPARDQRILLSEIESALKRRSVLVDESKLSLGGDTTLVLREGTSDTARVIETALKDAKLFDEVHAAFDGQRNELDVRVHASGAPTRAVVAKAIEKAGTKAHLQDVVWGPVHRT